MTSQPFTPTIPPPAGSRGRTPDRARVAGRSAHARRGLPARPPSRARASCWSRSSAASRSGATRSWRPAASRSSSTRRAASSHSAARSRATATPTSRACRRSAAAWSAASPTTPPRSFEPTVPLPPAREGDDEALGRFLFAPVVVAFDHVRQTLQVVAQPGYGRAADELCADLLGPLPGGVEPVPALSGAGPELPRAHAGRLRGDGARRAGAHRARRRLPDGALAADRAPDGREPVLPLPRAARRQPVALHGVLRSRRPPDRLRLARDPRLALARRRRHAQADRRHAHGAMPTVPRTTRSRTSSRATRRSAPST